MRSTIEQADWMDRITKSKALEKMSEMIQHVGFPDDIFNDTEILEEGGMDEVSFIPLNARPYIC